MGGSKGPLFLTWLHDGLRPQGSFEYFAVKGATQSGISRNCQICATVQISTRRKQGSIANVYFCHRQHLQRQQQLALHRCSLLRFDLSNTFWAVLLVGNIVRLFYCIYTLRSMQMIHTQAIVCFPPPLPGLTHMLRSSPAFSFEIPESDRIIWPQAGGVPFTD